MRRLGATLAAALAALGAGAAVASAAGDDAEPAGVSIFVGSYAPAQIDVLAGETVTWLNDSVRRHTVTATDDSWSSEHLLSGERFSRRFDAPAAVAYYCQLHPFMRGEVDVHRLLLSAPRERAAPGRPFVLGGRAALPEASEVSIEADSGAGFRPVAGATVGPDGAFHATVTPRTTTSFRAVAGDESSPPVQLLVLDRRVLVVARRRHGRVVLDARVVPASPGATVVLELRSRARFGWWPVRRTRLGRHSTARFTVRPRRSLPARVLLTQSDGATTLARSRTLRVGPRR